METKNSSDWQFAAQKIAEEGIVLLKNEHNILPIREEKVALFGGGQFNQNRTADGTALPKHAVSILEAFKQEGIQLDHELTKKYEDWEESTGKVIRSGTNFFGSGAVEMEVTRELAEEVRSRGVDKAIITIYRISCENRDMNLEQGDYFLSEQEQSMIKNVCSAFDKVILLLNVGGLIDFSFLDECKIDGILYLNQLGEIGATALAKIIKGTVNPSGKIPFSVAKTFDDYPSSKNFGRLGGGLLQDYFEDIYVGYRYFDNFKGKDKNLLFPFGYGLSYTSFAMTDVCYREEERQIHISVNVTNTGTCSGKEVVELYYGAPTAEDGAVLGAPPKQLCSFEKTIELAPGMSQNLSFSIDIDDMASYDDLGVLGEQSCFVMEKGEYRLWVGTHSRELTLAGVHEELEHRIVRRCHPITTTLSKRLNGYGEYDVLPEIEYDESRYHDVSAMEPTVFTLQQSITSDIHCFSELGKGDAVTFRFIPGVGGEYYVRFLHGEKIINVESLFDVEINKNQIRNLKTESDGTTRIILPPERCEMRLISKVKAPTIDKIILDKKDTKKEISIDKVNVIDAADFYETSFGVDLQHFEGDGQEFDYLTNFFSAGMRAVFQLNVLHEGDYDIAFRYTYSGEAMPLGSVMSVAVSNIVQPLSSENIENSKSFVMSEKSRIHLQKGVVYLRIIMERTPAPSIAGFVLSKSEGGSFEKEHQSVIRKKKTPSRPGLLEDFSNVPKVGIQLAQVYKNRELMQEFLTQLSNRELATLVSGTVLNNTKSGDVGCNHPLPARGVPAGQTADGPCGLRQYGYSPTAYPVSNVLCATWNKEIYRLFGTTIAKECKFYGVDYWLGPGINILRNPTGGRNFSYYSEDPYLAGITATNVISGLQEQGVAAVMKHYAANSTEFERLKSNSRVSERAIREIYIKAFELAVKLSNPVAIMSSYNHLNDVKVSENYTMITEIPRDEWKWEGVFFTDWGNDSSHIYELRAGHDMKMSTGEIDNVTKALDTGELERKQVEKSAERVLNMLMKIKRVQILLEKEQ